MTGNCPQFDNAPVPGPATLELLQPLSANPWFGALPLRERRAMLAACELQRLRPGEMLFRQGDAVPPGTGAFYGLASGSIKASSLREDGKEAILVVLEAGNWFGEISLIDQQPRTHDATAVTACEVLALPRAAFDAMMQRPVFARAISQMMAARVRALYGMVEDATLRSTRARVARRLLLLARGDATQATGLAYPPDVFSVSHVALPFADDDPLYGYRSSRSGALQLGAIAVRGERNALTVSQDSLTRLSHNPFHAYMLARIASELPRR